ncbi:hypothetical protein AB0D14_26165 [Streptomyces sp. NPDC048484]|uniref:hypothetical protein n=1 Tax=Streptomyces sp. NPDC048484 TaxID=3155146 RepID=UPI00341C7A32
MIHEIEGVERELGRVSSRPEIDLGTPILTYVELTPSGDPEAYSGRLRDVLAAVFDLAVRPGFDEDEVPVDTIPEWFVRACEDGAAVDSFVAEGQARHRELNSVGPWRIQDWLSRFDPELENRGWAFWDLTRSPDDSRRLRLWLDTWGEPFFAWEELRWLAYTCGAASVANPMVVKSEQWAREQSA